MWRIFLKVLKTSHLLFSAPLTYIILYFGGMVIAALSTLLKHKDDPNYASVGASGAVSAVLFTSIFFSPLDKILFYGVIPMPGFVFGILYLAYSTYMGRSGVTMSITMPISGVQYLVLFSPFSYSRPCFSTS